MVDSYVFIDLDRDDATPLRRLIGAKSSDGEARLDIPDFFIRLLFNYPFFLSWFLVGNQQLLSPHSFEAHPPPHPDVAVDRVSG